MSDAVMVPRAWLLKIVDTLKPFAEVAEKLRHCHVVEICEPHPDNPSPNIAIMPREWLERAGDDLEVAVIVLHRDGALSEGQAAKLTGLDRVEVRKLSDGLAASTPVGGWEEDARDISGETVMGMRVAAYRHPIDCPAGTDPVAWTDFFRGDPPNTYSEHWSTPGAHRTDVERLFTEADVRARFAPPPPQSLQVHGPERPYPPSKRMGRL